MLQIMEQLHLIGLGDSVCISGSDSEDNAHQAVIQSCQLHTYMSLVVLCQTVPLSIPLPMMIPKTAKSHLTSWIDVNLKPTKLEHIFVAIITFSPFLLCKYF